MIEKEEPSNKEDLHSGKDSHMSLPVAHDMEFHLRNADCGMDCEPGEDYIITVPVEVASKDEDMTRFRQTSPIKVGKVIAAAKMSVGDLRDHLIKQQSENA